MDHPRPLGSNYMAESESEVQDGALLLYCVLPMLPVGFE